jgi:electron transport complex protein RnfB
MGDGLKSKQDYTVYKQLAQRLDTIPNGFPATESGVELKLLAKLFTPEEAALALHLKLTPVYVEQVAQETGDDPQAMEATLKGMAGKGLIRMKRGQKGPVFGLMPFVVGIYEMQITRMDKELAQIFEDYYKEAFHKMLHSGPSIHRVIPVEQAVQTGLQVLPYESASEILSHAQSWGALDCICRVQKKLLGEPCKHPINVCLMFSRKPNAYEKASHIRSLTKEEALELLRQAEEAGLVHTTGNHLGDQDYICNCCACACAILRGASEFGILSVLEPSAFRISVDESLCVGCDLCIERCQFKALSIVDGVCKVDEQRCFGCGICISACGDGALSLAARPASEVKTPPQSLAEWMMERAAVRKLDPQKLEDVIGKMQQ